MSTAERTSSTWWLVSVAALIFVSGVGITVYEHVTDWRPRPTRISVESQGCELATSADVGTANPPRGAIMSYQLVRIAAVGVATNHERRPVRARLVATVRKATAVETAERIDTGWVRIGARGRQEWEIDVHRARRGRDPFFIGLPEDYSCSAHLATASFTR